jgi:septal ring factor EnvC (AmiA/AmiB activator)
MKTKPFIHTLGLTLVWLVCVAGCTAPPAAPNRPTTNPTTAQANFQGSKSGVPNAVQSAIDLSQKCAELSGQLTALQEEKRNLTTENATFKVQLAALEPKLQQAQKELGEANDLLMEMRLELNNWQNDVLGFRSEMRDADQAQLDALLKILMLLGGEISPDAPGTVNNQNNPTVSDPNV